MRKTALRIQNKQLKKRSLSITTRKLKKMEGHRIFDRGSGLLLIRCSTDFSRRKRHIFIVNLTSQYIYDGGRQFLPFRERILNTDVSRISLLKEFGIKMITEVYLLTSNVISKEKEMDNSVIQQPYGGIDLSKNDVTSKISKQAFLEKKLIGC